MRRNVTTTLLLLAFIILPVFAVGIRPAAAQQTELQKLQTEIKERSNRLVDIEREIAGFEADLKKVGAEKNTLQKAINQLELERKKVQADIRYTEQKINATDLELSKLVIEIDNTEQGIEKNKAAIAEIIRRTYKNDNQTLIELMLRHHQLSDFWSAVDSLEVVRNSMSQQVATLADQKKLLDDKRGETTQRRESLVDLRDQYDDQSTVLANNRAERAELLVATRSEEVEYQKLLKTKQAARAQIIKEVRDYEAKLQFILDPTSIPAAGTAVFAWPLKNVIITQLFGGTEFARRNASVYGGRAYHPGIDMGTPRGTPIFAPLAGTCLLYTSPSPRD